MNTFVAHVGNELDGLEQAELPFTVMNRMNVYFRLKNIPEYLIMQRAVYLTGVKELRVRIPKNIRVALLVESNLYIPREARICETHIRSNDWDEIIDSLNLRHDFNSTHMIFFSHDESFERSYIKKHCS